MQWEAATDLLSWERAMPAIFFAGMARSHIESKITLQHTTLKKPPHEAIY